MSIKLKYSYLYAQLSLLNVFFFQQSMFKLFTMTCSQRNTYSLSANLLLGSKYFKYHAANNFMPSKNNQTKANREMDASVYYLLYKIYRF